MRTLLTGNCGRKLVLSLARPDPVWMCLLAPLGSGLSAESCGSPPLSVSLCADAHPALPIPHGSPQCRPAVRSMASAPPQECPQGVPGPQMMNHDESPFISRWRSEVEREPVPVLDLFCCRASSSILAYMSSLLRVLVALLVSFAAARKGNTHSTDGRLAKLERQLNHFGIAKQSNWCGTLCYDCGWPNYGPQGGAVNWNCNIMNEVCTGC